MADISLREYLDKVDSLLGTPDEAIYHSRHILQYYPKNVAAYRYLGQALLNSSGLEEAGEVFRRVLSVYPDDTLAHTSLSEIYQRTGKPNEAIYHMERAFEQDPHNKTLIDNLRELYRKYRQEDYARLQLTTGAVARQYMRNGLYSQAIDTLQDALERSPNRHDLRLLLARTLWDSNLQVEAAEEALNVLKALPDCLEANRIMTQLWLSEGRPSDAQRYLSRIEAVDPYLALQIAQGSPASDTAFTLPEADYGSVERRNLETGQPDWLSEISQGDDWMSAVSVAAEPTAKTPLVPSPSEDLTSTVPDDWLTEDEPAFDFEETAAEQPHTGLTGLLANLDQPTPTTSEFQLDTEDFPAEETAVSSEMEAAEPLDWVQNETLEEEAAPVAEVSPGVQPDEADPLAWMQGTDIELVEETTPAPSFFDEEMTFPELDEADPLAWMQDTEVELVEEQAAAPSPPAEVRSASTDEDDPLAWLQDTEPAAATEAAGLNWLQDDSMLEEALDLEQLSGERSESDIAEEGVVPDSVRYGRTDVLPGHQPDDEPDIVSSDWRSDMNDQHEQLPDWLSSQSSEESEPAAPSQQPVSSDDDDQVLDWMMEIEEQPTTTAELDWLAVEPEEPSSEPTSADIPEWLTDVPAQPDSLAWLTEEEAAQPAADVPDWLSAAAPTSELREPEQQPAEEQPMAGDTGFEWLSEEPAEEEAAQPAADVPDWLSAAAPTSEPREPEQQPADTSFEWLSEQPAEEQPMAGDTGFEWLSEEPAEEEAAQPAADVPDWLSAAAPISQSDEEPAAEMGEVSFEWLSEEPEEPGEDQPAAETQFEWLTEEEAAEEEAQPASEVPDWLSAIAPPAEAQAASEADWLTPSEAELETEQPAVEAEAETFSWSAENEPSWLSELSAPEEEPTPDAQVDIPDAVEPAAAVSDWLEAEESELEEAPESVSEMDWTAEEPAEAEIPDWLSELQPQATEESASEVAYGEEAYDETERMLAAAPAPPPAENAPDWLNAMVPGLDLDYQATEDEPVEKEFAASARQEAGFDWLVRIVEEETSPIEPIREAPPARRRFVFRRQPAWLRLPQEAGTQHANDDFELPDWLK